MHIHIKKQNGFTVLFAVLVSSILLAVGASIFNITVKNLLFAGTGRESLKAFAAADTGLECALYWDKNGDQLFGAYGQASNDSLYEVAQCVGVVLADSETTNWSSSNPAADGTVVTKFSIETQDPTDLAAGGVCVDVTITKEKGKDFTGYTGTKTTIESRGHNTCTPGDRQLERAIKITYGDV